MYWLSIFRMAALAWASFAAILLVGFGAHTLAASGGLGLPTFAWAGLAVATAFLTLASLPAMLVIDLLRTGAFTSMIVVELAWLGFLGIMLLATGAAAADNAAGFWVQCSVWRPALARTLCSETSAAAAFGFLAWIGLWAYAGTLLVILIIQAQRGNYIWQQSIKEMNLKTSNSNIPPVGATVPGTYGSEPKAHEAVALNPGQHGYPPQSAGVSPQPTGYSQPTLSPQPTGYSQPGVYGQPANPGYPQV